MKKSEISISRGYKPPQCIVMTVEVGGTLTTSPASSVIDIKNPGWNTDGDYGLE